MEIPKHLSHKPIVAVEYSSKDSTAGDAKYLSIGQATWANNCKDYSAKVFRKSKEGEEGERWSRQSEELPLWRVLDLTILLVSQIYNVPSYLKESVLNDRKELHEDLRDFLDENALAYTPRLNELRRILCTNNHQNTPNIFSYATSELSQDAIIAWIISWADPSKRCYDESLNEVAISFLKKLINEPHYEIETVSIKKQWHRIDIGVILNNDIFLISEDKTNTSIHDDQLERYHEFAIKEFGNNRRIIGTYVKTGNETLKTIKAIQKTGYHVVERVDILECINKYKGNSDLIKYFRDHLNTIELKTNSFRSNPLHEWCWEAWEGFYRSLEECIKVTDWGYVANPSGGLLALNWHWVNFEEDNIRMYLQIEHPKEQHLSDKLSVKIEHSGPREKHSTVRNKYYDLLFKSAKKLNFTQLKRPKCLRDGTYMTIGFVDMTDIIDPDMIMVNDTIQKLKSYEHLLDYIKLNAMSMNTTAL